MLKTFAVWVLLLAVCCSLGKAQSFHTDSYRDNPSMMAFHPQKPDNMYCVTQDHGLVITSDGGLSWFNAGKGPKGQGIRNLTAIGFVHTGEDRVIIHASRGSEASQLYFYKPANDTWDLIGTDRDWSWIDHITTSPEHPDYIFVSGVEGCARYTISTDQWTSLSDQGDSDVTYFAVEPSDGDTYWQGTIPETGVGGRIFGKLYKSTDAGATWAIKMPQANGHISNMLFDPDDAKHLFVVAGHVYESFDAGNTYTTHPADTSSMGMWNFAVDWKNKRWYGANMNDSVYISTDQGLTWIPNSVTDEEGSRFTSKLYTYPHHSSRLFLLRTDGLFESFDYGTTWTRNPINFIPTAIDEPVHSPGTFTVSKPYPQPTVSGESVSFELNSTATEVLAVSVYNAFGQELSNTEYQMSIGRATVNIPTGDLKAGAYYSLFREGGQQQIRMILVR
jgi:hypothetical protein